MDKKEQWITVNGNHIPIKEGQTKEDAVENFLRVKNKFDSESVDKINITNQVDIISLLGKEIKGEKGQKAINLLLKEKQGHIKVAFHREDIGDIDLIWGNDNLGLQHIIKRREEDGINVNNFTKDLAEVIEKGKFFKKGKNGTFEFWLNGKSAIISPEYHNNKITFLLTAYKKTLNKLKAPK